MPGWEKIEKLLRKELFDNARFSELSRKNYERQYQFLTDKKAVMPLIEPELIEKNQEMNAIDNKIESFSQQIDLLRNEIEDWKSDRAILEEQIDKYPLYTEPAYQLYTLETGGV